MTAAALTADSHLMVIDPYGRLLSPKGDMYGRFDFLPRQPDSDHPDRGHPPNQLDSDLTGNPKTVSEKHVIFSLTGKGVRVEDFASDNGTFLGNDQVKAPVIIPWENLASARIRLGPDECFVIRFMRITQLHLKKGQTELAPRDLPPDYQFFQMVVGFCKRNPEPKMIVELPEEEPGEEREMTIIRPANPSQ